MLQEMSDKLKELMLAGIQRLVGLLRLPIPQSRSARPTPCR